MTHRPRRLACLLAAASLAACANLGSITVQPGQSVAEVERQLGSPTGRYALPDGGSRLEYARGPYGKQTWMIDVDAAGRVRSVQQVLNEATFATVAPGTARDDVLRKLGRPSERRGAYGNVELWQYRYDAIFCQWFVVTMTQQGTVRDTGYVPDPMCDDDESALFRGRRG